MINKTVSFYSRFIIHFTILECVDELRLNIKSPLFSFSNTLCGRESIWIHVACVSFHHCVRIIIAYVFVTFVSYLLYIDRKFLTRKPMAEGIFESNWIEIEKKQMSRVIEARWRSVISRRRARCQQRTMADSFLCVHVYRQSFVMHWHTLFLFFFCKLEKCFCLHSIPFHSRTRLSLSSALSFQYQRSTLIFKSIPFHK